MTITNYDSIINARCGGRFEDEIFFKTPAQGGVAYAWYSYIKADGQPNALNDTEITYTFVTTTLTCANHRLQTGDARYPWSSTTIPTGLTANTLYYVRFLTVDTFQLHPTAADATNNTNAISLSSGAGTHYLCPLKDVAGGGVICNAQTPGALLLDDKLPAEKMYMTTMGVSCNSSNMSAIMAVDVLWACRNVNFATGSLQTFGSPPALTRYTDGVGNRIMLQVTTNITTNSVTATIIYVDDTDTQRTVTTTALPININAPRLVTDGYQHAAQMADPWMPLHASSRGVKSIVSIQLSGSGFAAGVVQAFIVHPLPITFTPILANYYYTEKDLTVQAATGLVEIQCDSNNHPGFIGFIGYTTGATTSMLWGAIRTVYG